MVAPPAAEVYLAAQAQSLENRVRVARLCFLQRLIKTGGDVLFMLLDALWTDTGNKTYASMICEDLMWVAKHSSDMIEMPDPKVDIPATNVQGCHVRHRQRPISLSPLH